MTSSTAARRSPLAMGLLLANAMALGLAVWMAGQAMQDLVWQMARRQQAARGLEAAEIAMVLAGATLPGRAGSAALHHAHDRSLALAESARRQRLRLQGIDEEIGALRIQVERWRSLLPAAGGGSVLAAMLMLASERRRREKAEQVLRQLARDQESIIASRTGELRLAHERIQAFATELDQNIEAERLRIAREVHDQCGQLALAMQLRIEQLRSATPATVEEACNGLLGLLERAVRAARGIAAELRPPLLDDLGFAAAVRFYLAELSRHGTMEIVSDVDEEAALSARQANQLFRILQEALTNVFRHADATLVVVEGHRMLGHYELVVRDDGRGPQPAGPGAQGLRNMRERATLAGGTFGFCAVPHGGAQVTVRVPLAAPAAHRAAA